MTRLEGAHIAPGHYVVTREGLARVVIATHRHAPPAGRVYCFVCGGSMCEEWSTQHLTKIPVETALRMFQRNGNHIPKDLGKIKLPRGW